MTAKIFRDFLGCAFLAGALACQQPSTDNPQPTPMPAAVRLTGAVQKGPFVLGSTINVSPVDASGNPTGQVFNTKTTSDLGTFRIDFTAAGRVSLEGVGFYYNEVTGQLSKSQLTLRAFYDITSAGEQSAFINLVTHLTYDRVKTLVADGTSFTAATTQAEQELRQELGIGGAGFTPGKSGIEMNILGGDTEANSYLFAVSAVAAKVAVDKDAGQGSVDAVLQELLNTTALDLSDDGKLSSALKARYQSGQRSLDIESVRRFLQARLVQVDSTAAVPDLDKIIDSDGDGFVNATDTCPLVSNPDQTMIPVAICKLRNSSLDALAAGQYQDLLPGKFGGAAAFLVHVANPKAGTDKVLRVPYSPSGVLAAAQDTLFANPPGSAGLGVAGAMMARDVDGDGLSDLVMTDFANSMFRTWVYHNNGSGGFDAAKAIAKTAPNNDQVNGQPFPGFTGSFTLADFNKDGRPDFLGYFNTSQVLVLQQAGGAWAAPVAVYTTSGQVAPVAGDWNGDGNPDAVLLDYDGTNSYVRVLNGNGSGAFTLGSTAMLPVGGGGVKFIGSADFNQDGVPDLVVQVDDKGNAKPLPSRLYVLTSGPTGFTISPQLAVTAFDQPQLGQFTGMQPQILFNRAAVAADGVSLTGWNLSIASWDGTKLVDGPKTAISMELFLNVLPSTIDLNGDGKSDLLAVRNVSDITQTLQLLTGLVVN